MKHHIGTLQTMIAWISNIYFRLAKNQSNYIITLKIQYWHKPRISAENAGHWLLPNADIQWLPITGIFSSFCYRLILACHINFPPKIFLCSFRNSLRWIHKYLLSLKKKKHYQQQYLLEFQVPVTITGACTFLLLNSLSNATRL